EAAWTSLKVQMMPWGPRNDDFFEGLARSLHYEMPQALAAFRELKAVRALLFPEEAAPKPAAPPPPPPKPPASVNFGKAASPAGQRLLEYVEKQTRFSLSDRGIVERRQLYGEHVDPNFQKPVGAMFFPFGSPNPSGEGLQVVSAHMV